MDFKAFVKEYQQKVYWQVRRMVYNHEDTNDLVQDIFVKVYTNFDQFRGNAKLSSWVYRIAFNETINFLNKQARERTLSLDELALDSIDKLKDDIYFDGDDTEILLQKAIASLPVKQRMVFLYKYYEELKYDEIAEILGGSVGGLKASYHHAVKKIKDFIYQHH
ncbi:RNA polymerase sigma factor [Weeksella virosa]|uniref:RNA polymerase, sigma-24 subunit, ECF subfamily n=1 Tax=Weeksella virosa (strain ATCC 43766 / DSM 16922 / JCM 21250 / CCUG 30538 / CDC 9751 / IAM 14551 / NBRC 16016 / NCTC 11634 / CL345/78) TaxID=865938 RepID=F0NYR4_WEEVC|nr:RNA polymerase sigma factor [Weeksella virosa]ADX68195.1 RNA polymerase, sigma-24 subunit, ECF subfamily [Weeksella virosa DSM 16922]MDK7674850.1 RNA polymerase sigma factor [Weeksella virosa]VEH64168.1 RNA polymerase sigma factor sigV [Weeksella virosa]